MVHVTALRGLPGKTLSNGVFSMMKMAYELLDDWTPENRKS